MAQFNAAVLKVLVNGPYSYTILKDGVGQKTVNNVATVAAAINGIRDDIAGLLGGETVQRIQMTVTSD